MADSKQQWRLAVDDQKNFADVLNFRKVGISCKVRIVGFPEEGEPIAVLLAEHTIGRAYVKGMSEAFDLSQQGEQEANTVFIENARNYVSLLTQHIHKEDNILYPMANRQLSEETQDLMRKEFEIADKENIGFDKLEELHQILNHLKGIYLD